MRLVVAIHATTSSPPPLVLSEMALFTNCLEITLSSRLRSHTRSKMVLCPFSLLELISLRNPWVYWSKTLLTKLGSDQWRTSHLFPPGMLGRFWDTLPQKVRGKQDEKNT